MDNSVKIALAKIGPDKKTADVLRHIATRKRGITSWTAWERYNVTRLSSIIYNLRNTYHLPIVSEQETKDGVHYARYILIQNEV